MQRLATNYPRIFIFCLGCIAALGMAPVYLWPLTVFGYAYLANKLAQFDTIKKITITTFLFFFGVHVCGLYWVSSSLFVDLETWWWALPFSFVGLPALCALFPTALIAICSLMPRIKWVGIIVALCLADIARGHLFTGFPWNFVIHGFINTDLVMTTLPYIGFYGLNTVLVALSILIGLTAITRLRIIIICAVTLGFWLTPISFNKTPSMTPKNTILIQANIAQQDKWDSNLMMDNLNRYINMSSAAINNQQPHTIIWPETAISQNLLMNPLAMDAMIAFLNNLPKQSILITGFLNTYNGDHYNSLIVFDTTGTITARYDKHHLVPFGEYMPFGLDTLTSFSGFTAGASPLPINTNTSSFLPLICYEIIFPHYSRYVGDGDYILNITNDAWFGNTAGPYQHLDHARFRAIENQKPVLRLSGNGISGWIDENGRIEQPSKLNKQSSIIH